jgi:hypothetical protein
MANEHILDLSDFERESGSPSDPVSVSVEGPVETTSGTGASASEAQGTAADGDPVTGNPVVIAGEDPDGNVATLQTDENKVIKSRETHAPGYEDTDAGVARVEQRFTYQRVTGDTQVVGGSGFLHTLTFSCNDAAPTAGSIIVFDSLTETGTQIYNETFTTTPFRGYTVTIDASFGTGLYIGFTTTNDVNVTASYRAD